jgi:hypothetical protein
MIKLRALKNSGIEEFKKYIQSLKQGSSALCPDLNTEQYSYEYRPVVEIDQDKIFQKRLDIAEYLYECFEKAGIQRTSIIDSTELWTWLAYVWFNQVTKNRSRVGDISKYICSSDYTDYYRHSIAFAYNIYSLHGKENSKLLLDGKPYIMGDILEQIASREYIISNPSLIKAINILYWDADNNAPKKGATNRNKPGNIRRFVKIVNQIDLTYDAYGAPAKIISLLPKEFDTWRTSS